jgi:DNA repair photolyase
VTDPYQPIERKMKITRRCLQVLARFRNPVGILTKNRLVTRDIDVLKELAEQNAVGVNISVTSLDPKLQRILEPRTSPPQARLDAVAQFRAAGIPIGVMVAPIIPGITDHEMPAILKACGKAGAQFAGYVVLRLPWAVAPLFDRWLQEHFPDRKEKVLGRLRAMHGGDRVYDSRWRTRQTGEGIFAQQIETMFEVARRRAGIGERPVLSAAAFRRPNEQLSLL